MAKKISSSVLVFLLTFGWAFDYPTGFWIDFAYASMHGFSHTFVAGIGIPSEKLDKYEIAGQSDIGDAGEIKTEVLKDKPKVKFSKWNGEAQMGVRYMGIASTTLGSRAPFTNRVEWKDSKVPNEEMHAYPLEKGE